jgi:hypothetical protein
MADLTTKQRHSTVNRHNYLQKGRNELHVLCCYANSLRAVEERQKREHRKRANGFARDLLAPMEAEGGLYHSDRIYND